MSTTVTKTTSTYEPELDIKTITPHPANPRHTARADAELVDSIKSMGILQPLVVAPDPDDPTQHRVIAGHRRLDGAKKARLKSVPAIVRPDLATDAQQIEAAVVENVHRVDLTPIEEAEAFAQLRDLKWSQKKIADRTGRPIELVRGRLKLLTLSKKTQASVHKGQLTIGDALAIASFDDAAQARLTKVAGKPDFKHALQTEKSRAANAAKLAELLAKFDGLVDRIELKDGEARWNHPSRQLTTLYAGQAHDVQKLLADERKDHKDCLGIIVEESSYYNAGAVALRCVKPEDHEADFSDQDSQWQREQEQRARANEAARQARAAARQVRIDTVMELVGPGTRLDPKFVDVARVLLPGLLARFEPLEFETYGAALGIWESDDAAPWWKALSYGPIYKSTPKKVRAPFDEHIAEISDATAGQIARHLVAALLALAEARAVDKVRDGNPGPFGDQFTVDYYALLEALGFSCSDADTAVLDTAMTALGLGEGQHDTVSEDDEAAAS